MSDLLFPQFLTFWILPSLGGVTVSVCAVTATCPDIADKIQKAAKNFHLTCLDRKIILADRCRVSHLIAFAKSAQHTNKIISVLGPDGITHLDPDQSHQGATEHARHKVYSAIMQTAETRAVQFTLGTLEVREVKDCPLPRHLAEYFAPPES
jgi:hypothetical protein